MSESSRLLRDARGASGRTQAEVAAAAGVDQPQVSGYERGRREPTVPTLRRLLAGTGHRLDLVVRPAATLDGWQPMTLVDLGRELGATEEASRRQRLVLEFVRGFREAERSVQRDLLVERPSEVGERWDALLGALAEHFAFHQDIDVPAWATEEGRFLRGAWFWVDLPSGRHRARLTAPASFRRRNVWIDREDLEDR